MNMLAVLADNDASGCFVIFGIVLAAVIGVEWRRRTWINAMSSVANRWESRIRGGVFFSDPEFDIHPEGAQGRVDCHSGRHPWTRVRLDWRTSRRLRVMPEGLSSSLRRIFGSADITIGDETFDRVFWIEAPDAAWAREILDGDVRRRMGRLASYRTWMGLNRITIDVGPEGITVRIARMIAGDSERLDELIQLAVEIMKKARAAERVQGMVLAAVETPAGSSCPVCGHRVEGDGRNCPKCGTPHHEDCWKYFGGCAIYGCSPRRAAA
ncbi:MAG TPA: RING finger protein [Planctomycetota bacterium]|nr:RING finger protein [Planctomycetota bacterium]